jgi:hypothetical protein
MTVHVRYEGTVYIYYSPLYARYSGGCTYIYKVLRGLYINIRKVLRGLYLGTVPRGRHSTAYARHIKTRTDTNRHSSRTQGTRWTKGNKLDCEGSSGAEGDLDKTSLVGLRGTLQTPLNPTPPQSLVRWSDLDQTGLTLIACATWFRV